MELKLKQNIYVRVDTEKKVEKLKRLFKDFNQKTFTPDTLEYVCKKSLSKCTTFSVSGYWCSGLQKGEALTEVSVKELRAVLTLERILNRHEDKTNPSPKTIVPPKPDDPFARLKKAHKNGAEIEFKRKDSPEHPWKDILEPSWAPYNHYRIREVRVGDWFKMIRSPNRVEFFRIDEGTYTGSLKSENRVMDLALISHLNETLKL